MLSYCLKDRKNTESKNLKVVKTNKEKAMLSSKCAVCDSTKLKFINKQQASKLPLIGDILLWKYKMNEIVNELLLVEDIHAWNAFKTAWIYLQCLWTIC